MRKLAITSTLLCLMMLPACSTTQTQVKLVSDLPDAALVQPCDVKNDPKPKITKDIYNIATHLKDQRDECAQKVNSIKEWYDGAVKRAAK